VADRPEVGNDTRGGLRQLRLLCSAVLQREHGCLRTDRANAGLDWTRRNIREIAVECSEVLTVCVLGLRAEWKPETQRLPNVDLKE
jgi:hypothetical protein